MGRYALRLIRAGLGGEIDRCLAPVVALTLIYNASFSTFWVYVGVFAVEGLGWPTRDVGWLFLLSAPAAACANYLSGRLSDRVGRKRPIIVSFLAAAAAMIALSVVGDHKVAAVLSIVVLGVVGAPAYSLDRVLVADLVPADGDREGAYAAVRVASNFGVLVGPPAAGLIIYLGGWTPFLLGVAVLGVVGAMITVAFLPATGEQAREQAEVGSLRLVARDRPFLLLLLSTLLAFTVFCGFETVLPVVAVTTYGLAPSTWGLLVALSPLLVILCQLRLTRAAARVPAAVRLGTAIVVMGLPFLALIGSHDLAVIAGVVLVFVVGEMIWAPTSHALAAQLAPATARGTYFGALAATTGPAWTLAPLVALQLQAQVSVASVWIFFAGIAVAGAVAGVAAVRSAGLA